MTTNITNMTTNINTFEFVAVSTAGAPNLIFQFRGDTAHAELAGAILYAEVERNGCARMLVTSATGDVLANITLHPRAHRNVTENVIEVGSALMWSHWRWVESKDRIADD